MISTLSESEVVLEGEHLILKTLHEDHVTENYMHWLNDPEVNQYLETRSITLPDLRLKNWAYERYTWV